MISEERRQRVIRYQQQRERYLQARMRGVEIAAQPRRRLTVFGYALHPFLVILPLAIFGAAIVFDFSYLVTGDTRWAEVAAALLPLGVAGGVFASIGGTIDWWYIPFGTRSKAIGAWHGVGNVIVTTLFALSWLERQPDPASPGIVALLLTYTASALLMLTGWLGSELVDRLGYPSESVADAELADARVEPLLPEPAVVDIEVPQRAQA